MLILTRRIGETLMVGDEVTINVLDVKGNQAKLGSESSLHFNHIKSSEQF